LGQPVSSDRMREVVGVAGAGLGPGVVPGLVVEGLADGLVVDIDVGGRVRHLVVCSVGSDAVQQESELCYGYPERSWDISGRERPGLWARGLAFHQTLARSALNTERHEGWMT
jgi:hypothetical protein